MNERDWTSGFSHRRSCAAGFVDALDELIESFSRALDVVAEIVDEFASSADPDLALIAFLC